jgi:serine/threonine protein kinase
MVFQVVNVCMVIKVLVFSIIYCRGYLALEYVSLGQLSEKVDVYSFGVVLLEIISGRRSIDHKFDGDQIFLLNWVSNWSLHHYV